MATGGNTHRNDTTSSARSCAGKVPQRMQQASCLRKHERLNAYMRTDAIAWLIAFTSAFSGAESYGSEHVATSSFCAASACSLTAPAELAAAAYALHVAPTSPLPYTRLSFRSCTAESRLDMSCLHLQTFLIAQKCPRFAELSRLRHHACCGTQAFGQPGTPRGAEHRSKGNARSVRDMYAEL